MGCFLACFGSSKDRKCRKQRRKVLPRDQRNAAYNPVQSAVSLVQDPSEKPISPVSEFQDKKSEEQLGVSSRKKVTFDSNVKTYEHVSVEESVDFSLKKEEDSGGKGEKLGKPIQSQSSSDDSSITSSSGSYPPNHRYQNCRDSDDELEFEESDIDDDDDDDDVEDSDDGEIDYDDVYDDDGIVAPRPKISVDKIVTEEIDSSVVTAGLPAREVKPNPNVRDRSAYVHPVLNPVENLSQWKAMKVKGTTTPLKQQLKENLTLGQEPSFKELSFSFKAKCDRSKKQNQEIAVDASLSNWLSSSESRPINKQSTVGLDNVTPEKSMLLGSNSPRSFEDRPILGALTVEELKQLSASTSPRRSPSHSPDEMPIIGSVGTYWNNSNSGKDSGSASSYKGIPNTTSKYREDKRVNWHSTPFETRLERVLNGDSAKAHSTHASKVH